MIDVWRHDIKHIMDIPASRMRASIVEMPACVASRATAYDRREPDRRNFVAGNAREYDLSRFISAQAPVYPRVLEELRAGRKTSHWMWFVFPQIAGLGQSDMSQRYALSSEAEAVAYLGDRLLGGRLRECTTALLAHDRQPIEDMLGAIDAMKLRSSMTLFELVGVTGDPFTRCLDVFFSSVRDALTLRLIRR